MNVSILISTYNGSKYIDDLMNSLFNQTYENFKILIRDDGSVDDTKRIIEKYKDLFPEKVVLVDWENSHNIGFAASFYRLCTHADADLYFFCDQDDIWEQKKIETMLIQYKQEKNNKSIPILLHSDLSYISNNNNYYNSFFDLTRYQSKITDKVLFRGFLPGCTMAFNQELKDIYVKVGTLLTHDFSVYLIAKLYGKIITIDDKLIQYRLHENNTIGIGEKTSLNFLIKDFFKYFFYPKKYRLIILNDYCKVINQIRALDDSLYKKELYYVHEIETLSIIKRKKWFYNHFYPFEKGFFEGFVKLILF